ncbi:MAG: hypothetical protein Kow0092_26790 [Deferrisomatales bacterium]
MHYRSAKGEASLSGLCRDLTRADDLRSGLEALAWACDGRFPFYRVALALPTGAPHRLYVAAAWARRPEEELAGYHFVFRGHPLERAVTEGVPVVRTDPARDASDPRLARLYRGEGKVEELAAPLDLGRRRGLVVFASREKGRFTQAAVEWAVEAGRVFALWARAWAAPDGPYALKEQYETLLEGSLDGVGVLAGDRLVYTNASFREIFAGGAPEPLPATFLELLVPESREEFLEALALLERQPRVLPRIEVVGRGPGGRGLELDLGLQPILYRGEPATLLQVHNATERAEREKEAMTTNARLDALLHALAHDVRGPLNSILGFSELLCERHRSMAPEKVGEMLATVSRSGRTIQAVVDGLLEYSSVSASEAPVLDLSVDALLRGVEAELEGMMRSSGARIKRGPLPARVRGRAGEVERVFRNLVANAIRYARPGVPPVVRIFSPGQQGGLTVFCVEDNGEGIAQERLGEIFELFRKGPRGGTGVGLAIVARIVETHGGRVWVESEVGRGSRFYVSLPQSLDGDE